MWVIKTKGESYYVEHVECNVPWSTKETPNNAHTKGSIKVKRCLLVIDDDNTAYLSPLTAEDEQRLKKPEVVIRVITTARSALNKACEGVQHLGIKQVGGACSTQFWITEFNDEQQYVMFKLRMEAGTDLRELKPNEDYYKMYEKFKDQETISYIDEDDWYSREDDYEYDDISTQSLTLRQKMAGWFT